MTAARHAEIRRRYQRRKSGETDNIRYALRIKDIQRLINHRTQHHGRILPNNQHGREIAFAMACHKARRGDAEHRIDVWLGLWCPWMARDEATALLVRTIAKPYHFDDDKLGAIVRLTEDEREGLRITSIGAVGVPKAERERRRRERKRLWKKALRRARGAKPRGVYEAESLSKSKPWVLLGMSRRTWYRKCKPPVE
jgi:hypothetical protein